MEYIPAKTIVTNTKSTGWFGARYNMNIYRGCPHGCIYCDSRSDCYRNTDFDRVKAKENALEIIRDNLRSKVQAGVVATGSMSDPYNPFERREELTRHALELLSAFGFGVAIATKSDLITRDIDVLKEIQKNSPVITKITITTPHDDLALRIEPKVSSSSQRFQAVEELAKKGIFSGVLLMPTLPWITDKPEDMRLLLQKASDAGARFVYGAMGVTLRDGQREYFYNQLDQQFPGLKEKYQKRFGGRYSCGSPNSRQLVDIFRIECERLGLLYRMKDIVSAYKIGYQSEQLSFF